MIWCCLGTREAGCFREMAALHRDHFSQISVVVCGRRCSGG